MLRLSVSLRESLKIQKVLGDKVTNVKPASREMWPLEYIKATGPTSPGRRVTQTNTGKMNEPEETGVWHAEPSQGQALSLCAG